MKIIEKIKSLFKKESKKACCTKSRSCACTEHTKKMTETGKKLKASVEHKRSNSDITTTDVFAKGVSTLSPGKIPENRFNGLSTENRHEEFELDAQEQIRITREKAGMYNKLVLQSKPKLENVRTIKEKAKLYDEMVMNGTLPAIVEECSVEPTLDDSINTDAGASIPNFSSSTTCCIEGCTSKASAGKRNMCEHHYYKFREEYMKEHNPKCLIDGCSHVANLRGICRKHYAYLHRRNVFKKLGTDIKPEVLNEIYLEYESLDRK